MTTVATIEAKAVDRPQEFNLERIFNLAIEKQGAAETLERLMAIRREMNAEAAKRAFDMALTQFQAECPVINKSKAVMNKDGRSVRYHFAPLDSIVKQVRPLLDKHGFSYRITTATKDNKVKVICIASHTGGHAESSEFESPIDPQAFMNEQQKFAAALTYAKRYAFCNAFGILTGDEDLDGETKKPAKEQTREQLRELWFLLTPKVPGASDKDKDWTSRNQWLYANDILDGAKDPPELAQNCTAEQLQQVIKSVKEVK